MAALDTTITEEAKVSEDEEHTSQNTTSNGINYRVAKHNLYTVYVEGGGPVPKELKGKYTKRVLVEAAIEAYVAKRDAPKREYRKSRGRQNAERSKAGS